MSEGSLVNREFIGTILPDKDSKNRGLYKVNVPELQPHMKDTTGIWCKNHTCCNRVSPSGVGVCGSYYPLQSGMSVVVKCFANNIESAYIDRVISDQYTNSLPFEIIERDDYYQVIRTPKHNNLIAIYEGSTASKNVPKNSIHIYFNDTRSVVIIDEEGIHIITADNVDIKAAKKINIESVGDINITSGGKIKMQAVGDININAGAKLNMQSVADINVKSGANIKNQAAADIGLKASGNNYIEANSNHLKGDNVGLVPAGTAWAAPVADSAAVPDPMVVPNMITNSDYEYFKRNSGG